MSAPETPAPDAVATLIALARLVPSAAEETEMRTGFGALRTAARALYAVPEARYEPPALIFSARP